MDLGLRGKVGLVSGASEGIGRAAALALAEEGARLAICSRRPEPLELVAAAMRQRRPEIEVLAIPADVTRSDEVERLAEAVLARFGRVDVLVNAVGRGHRGTFTQLSRADWEASYQLNLLSAVEVTRRFLPIMLEFGSGRIINIAAVSGRQPTRGQGASNASKAALINFTKSLSNEVAERGVTVNAVLPGRILSQRVAGEFSLEQREERARAVPMRRFGTPDECAAAVVFLASEQAAYITGVALAVDGGLTASMF